MTYDLIGIYSIVTPLLALFQHYLAMYQVLTLTYFNSLTLATN